MVEVLSMWANMGVAELGAEGKLIFPRRRRRRKVSLAMDNRALLSMVWPRIEFSTRTCSWSGQARIVLIL